MENGRESERPPPSFLSPMCSAQKASPLLLLPLRPILLLTALTPLALASSAEESRKSRAKRRRGQEDRKHPNPPSLPRWHPPHRPRTDEVGGMEGEILEAQLGTLERRLIPCCCLPSPFTLSFPGRAAGPWVGTIGGEINRLKIGLPAQKTIHGL